MTFKETFQIIQSSPEFKEFKQKNPEAKLIAGFFIIDLLSNDGKKAIDYKFKENIYTFSLDNNAIKITEDSLVDAPDKPQLQTLNPDISIDLDEATTITKKRITEEGINASCNKIIAILQRIEDKQTWNLTCMLEGLIILHILIDPQTGDVIKFERKSMMDMIKKKE